MALFGSIFKGRGEKKEEPKATPAPAARPAAPAQQVAAPVPRKSTPAMASPVPPQKPMQLEEIVAALQQIETLMAEPSEGMPAGESGTSDRLQTVALGLGDIIEIVPTSFVEMKVSPGEKADVVIEDLFGQMAKGKIETTLAYLLAGVPRQYLANPAELKSELKVALPLSVVVAAVDPAELKKRTGNIRQDRLASELPNLFATNSAAPVAEKPAEAPAAPAAAPAKSVSAAARPAAAPKEAAAPAGQKPVVVPATAAAVPAKSAGFDRLSIKISDLKTVTSSSFKSAAVPPDARIDVPIDDVFGQLAKGSVKVPMNKLLAAVPKQYLSAGATMDSEALVILPLSIVVAAIPPDELKKRTAEVSSKPMLHDLPDLFKRAEVTAAPVAAAAAKPQAPAVPKVEPKAVPEAQPIPQPKPVEKAELTSRSKLELKPTGKPETKPEPKPVAQAAPKAEPKPSVPAPKAAPVTPASKQEPAPVAPAPKAVPVPPVPKAEPKPSAPVVPAAPSRPQVEPAVAFAGPAPKKFMPMDLVSSGPVPPSPVEQPAVPKVEKPKTPAQAAPVRAPASLSGIPALLLRGLDLNQASAEDLTRVVDGIGEAMAHRIVEDRTQNGPFFGLYDLGRVPGIGEKIYEKITGQPWLEEKYGQLPLVDELLGRWTGKHPLLKDVAEKFKKIAGFEGCMILHRDGDLLATSWQIESPEHLQAMAPQILKNVKHYMRHISSSETYSVTVFHEGFSFTFVESEDICFVAVHNPKGLSRRHIQIVNGLGVALGRRFSGYRGA